MDTIKEIVKAYSENVDCPDCPIVLDCLYENGEVFKESKCAEFVEKMLKGSFENDKG